jgi:hypothetical protein
MGGKPRGRGRAVRDSAACHAHHLGPELDAQLGGVFGGGIQGGKTDLGDQRVHKSQVLGLVRPGIGAGDGSDNGPAPRVVLAEAIRHPGVEVPRHAGTALDHHVLRTGMEVRERCRLAVGHGIEPALKCGIEHQAGFDTQAGESAVRHGRLRTLPRLALSTAAGSGGR